MPTPNANGQTIVHYVFCVPGLQPAGSREVACCQPAPRGADGVYANETEMRPAAMTYGSSIMSDSTQWEIDSRPL